MKVAITLELEVLGEDREQDLKKFLKILNQEHQQFFGLFKKQQFNSTFIKILSISPPQEEQKI